MVPARKPSTTNPNRVLGEQAEAFVLPPHILKSLLNNTELYAPERRMICELSRAVLHEERQNIPWVSIDIDLNTWCQTFGTDAKPARYQIEFSLQQLMNRRASLPIEDSSPMPWLADFQTLEGHIYRVEPAPWMRVNLVQLACIIKLQDIYDTL